MIGAGLPLAWQSKTTASSISASMLLGLTVNSGLSKTQQWLTTQLLTT